VEKYNMTLQQQLAYHKIPEKIANLQLAISKNQWNQSYQTQYKRIDVIITQAMLHAEKQSSKKYTGIFSWSPELIKSVQKERYWKLWLKISKGIPVSSQTLHRTQQAAGVNYPPARPTMELVVNALREAKRNRRELQKQHLTLRENYLS